MKLLAPSVKHTHLNKTSQYLLKPQSNTDFTVQLMIKPANHEYQYQLTNKTRKPNPIQLQQSRLHYQD